MTFFIKKICQHPRILSLISSWNSEKKKKMLLNENQKILEFTKYMYSSRNKVSHVPLPQDGSFNQPFSWFLKDKIK